MGFIGEPVTSTGADPETASHRVLALDALRGVAILLVLFFHLQQPPEDWPRLPRAICELFLRGGWMGVDLFFVLSGFLISGLLFQEYKRHGRIRVLRFQARRALKILPPFYLLIAATLLFFPHVVPVGPGTVLSELLFLQSYRPHLWVQTWSLAVEEHFYWFLPLLLVGLARVSRKDAPFAAIPRICLWLAVFTLALRCRAAILEDFDPYVHFYPTHLRIDSLFLGVFVSYLAHFRTATFDGLRIDHPGKLALLGSLCIAPAFVQYLEMSPLTYTFGFTSIAIGSGLLLIAALSPRFPDGRATRWLGWIGSCSYSIYLWHLPLRELSGNKLSHLLGVPRMDIFGTESLVYLAGALAGGILMGTLTERPLMRLRDALVPATRGAGRDPAGEPASPQAVTLH